MGSLQKNEFGFLTKKESKIDIESNWKKAYKIVREFQSQISMQDLLQPFKINSVISFPNVQISGINLLEYVSIIRTDIFR